MSEVSSPPQRHGRSEEPQSIRRRYEDLLWWSMDLLGISESIERKVVTAVVLQFVVTSPSS